MTSEQKSYINVNAVYCNDRNTDYSGAIVVNFPAYKKMKNELLPTFECEAGDRFKDGFGLMTVDEVLFSGTSGVNINNPSVYYYLNISGGSSTGTKLWWTMSPTFVDGGQYIGAVTGTSRPGALAGSSTLSNNTSVRPVISLKSCVTVAPGGDGTGTNPYVVNGTC